MRQSERAILHVDMDAFYASVEQRDQPSLKGQPVIVGGTGNRGVVAAASYEAREFGVRSAMPARRARELCPDGVFIRPRFSEYKQASQQIFAIFEQFTPLVQGLSLDEAFLDVTAAQPLFGDIETIGHAIKDQIRQQVNLVASVGLAPNKFLAKLASDHDKPDGFFRVHAHAIREFLDPLPIRRMWGVGPAAGERLTQIGIHTIGDLHRCPLSPLAAVAGKHSALRLKQLAAGEDERPVVEDAEDKSISCEETFEQDLRSLVQMQHALTDLCERLAPRLEKAAVQGHVVTIKVRSADFTTNTRQRRVDNAIQSSELIRGIALELLTTWQQQHPDTAVRLLGVGLSDLRESQQQDLFAQPELEKVSKLDRAVAEMRGRWGDGVIRRGGRTPTDASGVNQEVADSRTENRDEDS